MKIGVLCPSEIAIRRFMPALENILELNYVGVGINSAVERYGKNLPEQVTIDNMLENENKKAAVFAQKYGGKIFDSYEKMITSKEIDAVYIATPHSHHMEYAIKCIKAKKHILCEKPFSYNKKTSEKVLSLAKENNVFIMEALWTLFLPAVNKAKSWIDEGKIGKVKMITANFGFESEVDVNSRLYNPNLAGGALLDVGIYPILLSNFIMNDIPKEINATAVMTSTNA